jgi:hypothetical protein
MLTDKPFTLGTLTKRIQSSIFTPLKRNTKIPDSVLLNVIDSCVLLHSSNIGQPRVQNGSTELLHSVLYDDRVRFWTNRRVLNHYFVHTTFDPWRSLELLQLAGDNVQELVYVLMRKALKAKDYQTALEFAKLAGTSNLSPTGVLIVGVISFSDVIAGWGLGMPAVFTLAALGTVFTSICANKSVIWSTPRVCWRSSVSIFERFKRTPQLAAASRVVQTFDESTLNVATFHHQQPYDNHESGAHKELRMGLREMGMILRSSEEDQLYNEYWRTAGEGFEWVEPDQDPTDNATKRSQNDNVQKYIKKNHNRTK